MRKRDTRTDWLRLGTDLDIDQLRDYLQILVKQLQVMADDLSKKIELEASNIEDEFEKDQLYEFHNNEYWNYKDEFPRILLNSFHVSAYAFLESEFASIATRIGKKRSQLFDVSDIRGSDYLQSACVYIERLTAVDCRQFTSWNAIAEGRRLRNIIVHSNARLVAAKDIQLATKHKVISKSGIELGSGRTISAVSITQEYAAAFLDVIKAFLDDLYKLTKEGDLV